jgi:hypothetical protein
VQSPLFVHAGRLADRPRRGKEWKPSQRTYLLAAAASLLIAGGALLNLLSA